MSKKTQENVVEKEVKESLGKLAYFLISVMDGTNYKIAKFNLESVKVYAKRKCSSKFLENLKYAVQSLDSNLLMEVTNDYIVLRHSDQRLFDVAWPREENKLDSTLVVVKEPVEISIYTLIRG